MLRLLSALGDFSVHYSHHTKEVVLAKKEIVTTYPCLSVRLGEVEKNLRVGQDMLAVCTAVQFSTDDASVYHTVVYLTEDVCNQY